MASQLMCDLDTQQTVYVPAEGRCGGRAALDGPGGPRAAQEWTPLSADGQLCARQPLPAAWRGEQEASDAASLLWLLDYRLDHLLSPGGTGAGPQTQQNHHHHYHQRHQQHQEQEQQQQQQQQQYEHHRQQQRQQRRQDSCALHTQWDAANLQTVPHESVGVAQEHKQEGENSIVRE